MNITVKKTIPAEIARVFEAATDYERLPQTVPAYKSIKIRSRRGSTSVVEQRLCLAGRTFLMMAKHVADAPRAHTCTVIGGQAKGSVIEERYEQSGPSTRIIIVASLRLPLLERLRCAICGRTARQDIEEMAESIARAACA